MYINFHSQGTGSITKLEYSVDSGTYIDITSQVDLGLRDQNQLITIDGLSQDTNHLINLRINGSDLSGHKISDIPIQTKGDVSMDGIAIDAGINYAAIN
jgi:hypothetical protein